MTKNKTPKNRYWGDTEPPKSKADFFSAITGPTSEGADSQVATIRMYGPIDSWGGWWGISTKDIGEVLDALPESVTQIILRINSGGGECYEAVSILNMLRAHRAQVIAVVDGLAASAASVIASGCEETVMSPGTQMMIHSPSWISWGNARDFRKDADYLDKLEASLVEIYRAKAGEKNWPALLEAETWLTSDEAVELGLADRVGIVADAGVSETVGADDEITLITIDYPDEEDAEDSVARVTHLRGSAAAAALHRLPSSSEPGNPNREEDAVAYSDLKAGLQTRLGVTDADASDDSLLAAVDQALAKQPAPTNAVPDGVVQIDAAALEVLQEQARAGAEAREQQTRDRRDAIVATAVREGRIAPAAAQNWRDQLETAEDSITTVLNTLPKNTIPVSELGHSDEPTSADEALYARAFGPDKKDS